jgi:hypothetical protein
VDDFNDRVAANLASLNEIVTELAVKLGDELFGQVARTVLREHTHAIGYHFQGEPPPGVDIEMPEPKLRLPGIKSDILLERTADGVRMTLCEDDDLVTIGDYGPAEITLTAHGLNQLVAALQEVLRAPAPKSPGSAPA